MKKNKVYLFFLMNFMFFNGNSQCVTFDFRGRFEKFTGIRLDEEGISCYYYKERRSLWQGRYWDYDSTFVPLKDLDPLQMLRIRLFIENHEIFLKTTYLYEHYFVNTDNNYYPDVIRIGCDSVISVFDYYCMDEPYRKGCWELGELLYLVSELYQGVDDAPWRYVKGPYSEMRKKK